MGQKRDGGGINVVAVRKIHLVKAGDSRIDWSCVVRGSEKSVIFHVLSSSPQEGLGTRADESAEIARTKRLAECMIADVTVEKVFTMKFNEV